MNKIKWLTKDSQKNDSLDSKIESEERRKKSI